MYMPLPYIYVIHTRCRIILHPIRKNRPRLSRDYKMEIYH